MITHCVFVAYRPDVPSTVKQDIVTDLHELTPLIDGMIEVRVGANVSPEGLDKGFSEGFMVTFRDAEARDRYLVHPEHVKLGGRIVSAAKGGVEGIMVYDLEYD